MSRERAIDFYDLCSHYRQAPGKLEGQIGNLSTNFTNSPTNFANVFLFSFNPFVFLCGLRGLRGEISRMEKKRGAPERSPDALQPVTAFV
jgi:hypothetical protein